MVTTNEEERDRAWCYIMYARSVDGSRGGRRVGEWMEIAGVERRRGFAGKRREETARDGVGVERGARRARGA